MTLFREMGVKKGGQCECGGKQVTVGPLRQEDEDEGGGAGPKCCVWADVWRKMNFVVLMPIYTMT
jgi:hypothetical protein